MTDAAAASGLLNLTPEMFLAMLKQERLLAVDRRAAAEVQVKTLDNQIEVAAALIEMQQRRDQAVDETPADEQKAD